MTISVIIPVYNVEAYIGHCLQSVLSSKVTTNKDYEIIIVNDGSTDKSMEIVGQLCKGLDNVTIVSQKNFGLSSARMTGLKHAKGDYVWFIDSDDFIEHDAIESLLAIIKEQKESLDLIMMPLVWLYSDPQKRSLDYCIQEDIILDGKNIIKQGYFPVWAATRFIIRRDLFNNPSIFFPLDCIHEDEYFGRVLLYEANRVLVLKNSYYNYRLREGSITSTPSIKSSYSILSIYKLLEKYNKTIVSKEDKQWFNKNNAELLLQCYKKMSHRYDDKSFIKFRKKHALYILVKELSVKEYSMKERFWLTIFILSPRLHAKLTQ